MLHQHCYCPCAFNIFLCERRGAVPRSEESVLYKLPAKSDYDDSAEAVPYCCLEDTYGREVYGLRTVLRLVLIQSWHMLWILNYQSVKE
jgi:hypothetical protein